MSRRALVRLTLFCAFLLIPLPEADAAPLSRADARAKAWSVLEVSQVAYFLDPRGLPVEVAVEPARSCARLSPRRVRCAYAAYRRDLEPCGDWITLIRWRARGDQPAYIGWMVETDPLEEEMGCSARAEEEARAGLPTRGLDGNSVLR